MKIYILIMALINFYLVFSNPSKLSAIVALNTVNLFLIVALLAYKGVI